MRVFALAAVAVLAACGSDEGSTDTTEVTEVAQEVSPEPDRGPTSIALDGDANGLWWDAASSTLYIADDNGNRVLAWTEGAGTRLVAELPSPSPDGAGLGQLVKLPDGRIVVTRFGYGSLGDVVVVATDGTATVLAGLDPTRRRIGLALAPDGTLYTSWFTKTGQNPRVGAVGKLTLDPPSEVVVVEGLTKPVGVLATETELIISDQDLKQVLVAQRANPTTLTVRAAVDGLDLIGVGPDGSVFVGGSDGAVRRVSAAGVVTTIAGGFLQVRGVAWDAANRRLFIAEHDPKEEDGIAHALHILPLD